ncbi:MAG: PAS domain S-box protein [Saprospiraceae bacterium]|nr:PAS domain S-box protein [Saprospiraceae bacterium]
MPHGHCYFWKPGVLWTNVLGDGVIALSYFIIPFLLIRFLQKRKEIKFRNIFIAFAAFILACGTTHLIDIISVWHPVYRFEGLVKVITAAISIATVGGLFYYFPIILKIPTPEAWTDAKEQVLRSDHRFKTLMENAPTGVAITSYEGMFLEVNEAMCRLFNYDKVAFSKLNFIDVTHPSDVTKSLNVQMELDEDTERGFVQFEKRYLRKDGSSFWALVGVTRMQEERCNLVNITDITARKLSEQQLESTVEARTKALAASNKDLENFIYVITHDLRVPLHNLGGLSSVLKEALSGKENSQDALNALQMIGENAHKMDALVTDLLQFSRTTGQQNIVKKTVNVNALMQEVFDELKQNYRHKKIDFHLQDIPEAYGDPAALRQVCHNLISNALKYASKEPQIRIEVIGWVEDGHSVYKVKDNGSASTNGTAINFSSFFSAYTTQMSSRGQA